MYSHVDRSSTQNWINIDWKWPSIGHFICGSPLFPPNHGHSTGQFQVVQQIHYMEESWNRGTPSHPFIDRIFHERNHPAIGYPYLDLKPSSHEVMHQDVAISKRCPQIIAA
jgi:hypothetical protein